VVFWEGVGWWISGGAFCGQSARDYCLIVIAAGGTTAGCVLQLCGLTYRAIDPPE
jgi:hypothetical protein